MVRCFLLSWYGIAWAAAALALWAAGVKGASARYDTATPYTPPYTRYKYIPLQSGDDRYSSPDSFDSSEEETSNVQSSSGMAPSEFILTALRTVLDVVRKMNANRQAKQGVAAKNTTAIAVRTRADRRTNSTSSVSGRGYDYYDEHDDHYHETTTTAKPVVKQGRYQDPWAGYYDWIINEGSFKFWSVFQLFTAALLLYAALSAIYYAKFNPIIPDYDREYDDYFLERSAGRHARSLEPWELPSGLNWVNPTTFQFILDAISTKYGDDSLS